MFIVCFLFAINLFILRSYALNRNDVTTTPSLSFLPRLGKDGRTVEEKAEEAVLQAFVSLLDSTVNKEKLEISKQNERLSKEKLRGVSSSEQDSPSPCNPSTDNLEGIPSATDATTETGQNKADPSTLYTHQTCYLNNDESELCTYDNLLCYDGEGPVVIVPKPIREPSRILDYTHECVDNRFLEPSSLEWSNCHWAYAVKRPYRGSDVPEEISPSDHSLPLDIRRWGPLNRNQALIFREISPIDIFGSGEENLLSTVNDDDIKNMGKNTRKRYTDNYETLNVEGFNAQEILTMIDHADPFANADIPGMKLRSRYRVPNPEIENKDEQITIDWLDGTLWLAALDLQWQDNPYHFLTKASLLYDAQRSNITLAYGTAKGATFETGGSPFDGFVHWQSDSDIAVRRSIHKLESSVGTSEARNRALWRIGSQWGPLPPLDNILFVGEGSKTVTEVSRLSPWASGILRLINQRQTKVFFNDALSKYNSKHLLCARRGVVIGTKPKVFSGRSDAILFRNRAYKAAGIGIEENGNRILGTYSQYPPRHITVIDRLPRSGRNIHNLEELKAILSVSGLTYEIIDDFGKLTFEDQILKMSRTGILIAPHGAALANIMFLPAHAVVIELFPFGLRRFQYSEIANTIGLLYFPVYSLNKLPPESDNRVKDILYSRSYYDNCVKQNVSAVDAYMIHECVQVGRMHPVIIPIPYFRDILTNAIDAIGAFSQSNAEWAEYTSRENIQPLPFEEWSRG